MPKARNVDPTFWDDPDVARLSRDERLLLIGMIANCADDEGRLLADPGYLRKRVFGYDDDLSREDVGAWRDAIVTKCRNVKLYEADGQQYIYFPNWATYQNIRYVISSKLPAPPADCDILPEITEVDAQEAPITDISGNLPQSSVNSPRVGLGRVGLGGGENARATPTPLAVPPKTEKLPQKETARRPVGQSELKAVPKPPVTRSDRASPLPATFEVTEDMRAWAAEKVPRLRDLDRATEAWVDHCFAKKVTNVDWLAAWRQGMRKAETWQVENDAKVKGDGHGQPTAKKEHWLTGPALRNFEEIERGRAQRLAEDDRHSGQLGPPASGARGP